MKIVSTNIGQATSVFINNKEVKTGFYKTSVEGPITLGLTDVVGDVVVNRKHHGGVNKACYLYSADHYPFWRKQFPDLYWSNGMFGENLTVEGLDEAQLNIGDTFQVGTAIIQVSEPRRPCSVLGIRFGTPDMINLFNSSPYPGTYVRVLKEGNVKVGDELILIAKTQHLSIKDIFSLFSKGNNHLELAKTALNIDALSEECKNSIKKKFNIKP